MRVCGGLSRKTDNRNKGNKPRGDGNTVVQPEQGLQMGEQRLQRRRWWPC